MRLRMILTSKVSVLIFRQIDRIACIAFETARKRRGKLCSVDKANILEVFYCNETCLYFQNAPSTMMLPIYSPSLKSI